ARGRTGRRRGPGPGRHPAVLGFDGKASAASERCRGRTGRVPGAALPGTDHGLRGRDAVSRGGRSFAARPGDLYPDRAVDAVRRHRAGRVTMKPTTKGFPAVLTAGLVIMWLLLN